MGEKNMFKKSSKIFDREGFYIILFVCLCIVAVTAVYISRNNANTAKKTSQNNQIQQNQRSTDPLLTDAQKEKALSLETSKSTAKSTKDVAKDMEKNSKVAATKTVKHGSNIKLSYPVEGKISKKFDNKELQEAKAIGQWETHEGIDIVSEIGTDVKAAQNGKIVDVITKDERIADGEKTGFGTTVVIDHGNGIRTLYSNLSVEDLKVKKGDEVKQGQPIGKVGDTSMREAVSIEGSHLHFAVLKKSGKDYITVNPQEYLK